MGKSKKKSKDGKKKKKEEAPPPKKEPMAPDYVPPAPRPGERLLKILTTHKVDEKELHGFKVSTRALEQLTPSEIRDLRLVFDIFDALGKGFIGPNELKKAMKALGFKVTRDQARQVIQDASLRGGGVVDFNEFLDIVIDRQGDSRDIYEEIMQGFKMFDYESTGKISMEDLKQSARDAGVKFSKQELQEMMEEADLNGDGFVDKEEFIKIMLQTNLF